MCHRVACVRFSHQRYGCCASVLRLALLALKCRFFPLWSALFPRKREFVFRGMFQLTLYFQQNLQVLPSI